MEAIQGMFGSFMSWVGGLVSNGIGTMIFELGCIGEVLSSIGIAVGLFMIKFRMSKILRMAFMAWVISLVIELIGLAMRG